MKGDNVTPSSGNIWRDMGRDPDVAAKLRIKADLMMEIRNYIRDNGLTQRQAAELLGVAQPRISNLVNGKIGLFSIDMLIEMLTRAGLAVRVEVHA